MEGFRRQRGVHGVGFGRLEKKGRFKICAERIYNLRAGTQIISAGRTVYSGAVHLLQDPCEGSGNFQSGTQILFAGGVVLKIQSETGYF